jgi:hypothetical protein
MICANALSVRWSEALAQRRNDELPPKPASARDIGNSWWFRKSGGCAAFRLPRSQEAIATVRGCRRPMTSTQIVPIVATAAIGVSASGKLPVSA